MVNEQTIQWEKVLPSAWWKAMATCEQDPSHHAEGDVASHTRLVVEQLENQSDFETLAERDKKILRLAALLHDSGKPATTKIDDQGRITSNGHARVGAIIARRLLWELGTEPLLREEVCALVRWHMRPGFFLQAEDPTRVALTIAQTTRCDLLTRLAEADIRGRIAPNTEDSLVRAGLFGEACRELGAWSEPFAFASDHSRFQYFRTPGRDPHYEAFDDTRGQLTLMCGLPGAGKDTWIQENLPDLPVVSLDALRKELKIAASDPQEPVAFAALERARGFLRAGQDFVWNATNLRHELRARPIGLAADYNFRVKIIYREATYQKLFVQNRSRATAVPEAVMHRYIDRWEMPSLVECHELA
jgi:putative nucleotidyltransferase with HDIG domain